MARRMRLKMDKRPFPFQTNGQLGGWYDGKHSYLWFGMNDVCKGTISGQNLYRMAKAFVK